MKAPYLLLLPTVPPGAFLEFNDRYSILIYVSFRFTEFVNFFPSRVLCFYIVVYDIEHLRKKRNLLCFVLFFESIMILRELTCIDVWPGHQLRFSCWNQFMIVSRISLSLLKCHCVITAKYILGNRLSIYLTFSW